VRVLIGIALFAGAYMAEVIRGGLQAIPRGRRGRQRARPVYWDDGLIVMPQALKLVIPGIVNLHRPVQGHDAGARSWRSSICSAACGPSFTDPNWATADHAVHRLRLHRHHLLRLLLSCRATRCSSRNGRR
jgi:general L-amino acid transport system permease protein